MRMQDKMDKRNTAYKDHKLKYVTMNYIVKANCLKANNSI